MVRAIEKAKETVGQAHKKKPRIRWTIEENESFMKEYETAKKSLVTKDKAIPSSGLNADVWQRLAGCAPGGGAHGRPPGSALFVTFLPSHGASCGL